MQVKSKSVLYAKSEPRKPHLQSKLLILFELAILILAVFYVIFGMNLNSPITSGVQKESKFSKLLKQTPSPSPSPTPIAVPTLKPLSLAEMNSMWGPCARVPVLMYHHIQSRESAVQKKQTGLTVYTDTFETQIGYLNSKGYKTISAQDLINFFDLGFQLPEKSIIITFDDGYEDFYTDAYPILYKYGFKSVVFVATGLINNPGYLSWNQISNLGGLTFFGNHTWSHKNVMTETSVVKNEIQTADLQLAERGLNNPKIFAYPYGVETLQASNYLDSLGYKISFTTKPGSVLCKGKRFSLPRVRIGNLPIASYGF